VDTPGFQRPRRVLQWLEAHSISASVHLKTVRAFVLQHQNDDRLILPALNIGPLKDGLKTASFGPVQDSQFGYVVLGRAVDHWLEQLDETSRREIQRAFDRCRKQRLLTHQQRENFTAAIEQAMSAYDD